MSKKGPSLFQIESFKRETKRTLSKVRRIEKLNESLASILEIASEIIEEMCDFRQSCSHVVNAKEEILNKCEVIKGEAINSLMEEKTFKQYLS